MFMRPNSVVVEIVDNMRDLNMPHCGYYGPFAAIFGHSVYVHAYEYEKLNETLSSERIVQIAMESRDFYVDVTGDRNKLNIVTAD